MTEQLNNTPEIKRVKVNGPYLQNVLTHPWVITPKQHFIKKGSCSEINLSCPTIKTDIVLSCRTSQKL